MTGFPELPAGFGLAMDGSTRRLDRGRTLIGGTPLRIFRLAAAGAAALDAIEEGQPIGSEPSVGRLARRLVEAGMAHPVPPATRGEPMSVTVVIPVRDRSLGLAATLAALGPEVPIVVVDDGSNPREEAHTAAMAARRGARLVRRPVPGGPAAARNSGWEATSSDLVAFVDADCVPAPGWIADLGVHFQDPCVGAVAPRIVSATSGDIPTVLGAYEQVRSPLDRGPAPGPVRPRGRVPYVPSAALIVRRSDLVALDGFDERMRVGEDVDLVWRLGAAGRSVRYVPDVTVVHPPRASWAAWLRQRIDYGRSAAGLDARHPGAVAPLTVSGWSAGAWGLGALVHPGLGVTLAAVTTALLPARLGALDHPWRESMRLAGLGHLWAGRSIADALRRAWWPAVVVGALGSVRLRRVAVAAALLPAALEWAVERPPVDPGRWIALRLVDDVAYGWGVWAGCLRARRFGALRADLANWPGRNG